MGQWDYCNSGYLGPVEGLDPGGKGLNPMSYKQVIFDFRFLAGSEIVTGDF